MVIGRSQDGYGRLQGGCDIVTWWLRCGYRVVTEWLTGGLTVIQGVMGWLWELWGGHWVVREWLGGGDG